MLVRSEVREALFVGGFNSGFAYNGLSVWRHVLEGVGGGGHIAVLYGACRARPVRDCVSTADSRMNIGSRL